MIRLPFVPLERWFTLRHLPPDAETAERERNLGHPLIRRMADTFGVTDTTINAWKRRGLPVDSADKVAVLLGVHPVYFWPDWFDLPQRDDDTGYGDGSCSTFPGYRRHFYRGETPCPACRQANIRRSSEYRRRKAAA